MGKKHKSAALLVEVGGRPVDPNAETAVPPAIEQNPRSDTDVDADGDVLPPAGGDGVMLEIPVGPPGGYVTRGFSRDLSFAHAAIVRRVINQLSADGVRLSNGRLVERPEDVLCYVAEQIQRTLTARGDGANGATDGTVDGEPGVEQLVDASVA